MVRFGLIVLLLLSPAPSRAQSAVDPSDLVLTVLLEKTEVAPFQHEMVLLTIHGVYRRHITLETLEQPDLEGFNWMQLGQDDWFESTLDGKAVKNMRRRMALFPQQAGRLKIGAFTHHLTLLDENNNWFEYDITSEPLVLEVKPAPQTDDWWFPVRRLEITDNWSNAPDQLGEGEGVLRIITISALGVSPDMIPPMPELRSPSAQIFPHPEKRLVNLSPNGPVTTAFWRWTIKPSNPPSAILEPIEFSFFDTVSRQMRTAVISAQRVAMADGAFLVPSLRGNDVPVRLRAGALWLVVVVAFLVGLGLVIRPSRRVSTGVLRDWFHIRKLKRTVRRSARAHDLVQLRKASHALDRADEPNDARKKLLTELDAEIYGRSGSGLDLAAFHRRFQSTLSR
ncbi:MAG: hypothetical protein WBN04_03095 [Paracoccaceae bacterium]